MKTRIVFPIASNERDAEGRLKFFHHTAPFLLKSYLSMFDVIVEHYDIEIVELVPFGALSSRDVDRHHHRALHSLLQRRPKLVAFSLYSWNIEQYQSLARILKQLEPDVLLLAGGPEVYDRPGFAQQFPVFDILIEGDGEIPLRRTLTELTRPAPDLTQIENVSSRCPDGSFTHGPSSGKFETLDALPNFYAENTDVLRGLAFYMTTRGCSNSCAYCLWAKQPLRRRSQSKIMEELDTIIRHGDIRHIVFWDFDLIEVHRQSPHFVDALIELLELEPSLTTSCFATPQSLLDERLDELIKGLRLSRINVGVQSTTLAVLEATNRSWCGDPLQSLAKLPEHLKELLFIELIYPLPGETPESFVAQLIALTRLGYFQFQIFPLMVLRGTALYRDASRLGLKVCREPPYYCFETPSFPRQSYVEIGGLASVLTSLAESARQIKGEHFLQSYFLSHPNLVEDLLTEVRQGTDVDRLMRRLLDEIYGPEQLSSLGQHGADCKGRPLSDDRLDVLPPVQTLEPFFRAEGVVLREAWVENGQLNVRLERQSETMMFFLFSAAMSLPYYRSVGRFKVGYAGKLEDMALLDRLVDFLGGLKNERGGT